MIKNYLKVAWKNILKDKIFSVINIFGLSLSMATCLLIILLVYSQKRIDDFHQKDNRIVRILSEIQESNFPPHATSPLPLGKELLENYPHIVEKSVRIKSSPVGGDVSFIDKRVSLAGRYVDENFFNVFDFKLISGNPQSVMKNPFTMVLSEESAKKLFGNEDPIGKSVKLNDIGLSTLGIDILDNAAKENMLGDFTITGVVDTTLPSHINFDFLISMSTIPSLINQGKAEVNFDDWKNYSGSYLYLLLKDEKAKKDLEPILQSIAQKRYAPFEDLDIGFRIQPLPQITPGKFLNNPISLRMPLEGVYFFFFLGLVVLFAACFNYVNLSFAKSLNRFKEIGIRKVVGAKRRQLFFQFIIESIIVAFISFILAVVILQILSIFFLNLWINEFIVFDFAQDAWLYLMFIVFAIAVGVLAGIFPALFLSKLTPIKTLENFSANIGKSKKLTLRKFLVVLQFSVSLFLIISTILIYFQLNHLLKAEYGFDQNNIVNVKLQGLDYETLSNEFSRNPSIETISASSFVPGTGISYQTVVKNPDMIDRDIETYYISVNQEFIPNLDIKIKAGSNFPKAVPKNEEQVMLVNEAVALLLGYKDPTEIIGEVILVGEEQKGLEVIGLVENFYFELLMESDKDEPLLLRYIPNEFNYINVGYSDASNFASMITFMEQKWENMDKVHSFKYKVYEQELKSTTSIFSDLMYILSFVSFLAISISCLGLLGMATFTAQSKKKEIRIRKIHSAKIKNIVFLLSKEFLWLFVVSIVITVPITYLINDAWLQEFSYRVDFNIWIILLGVGIMFLLGFGTILSQTFKVAASDPLKGLRNE